MEKIFPTTIIVLNLFASIFYIFDGDWRRFIYWLCAAILTFTVTY